MCSENCSRGLIVITSAFFICVNIVFGIFGIYISNIELWTLAFSSIALFVGIVTTTTNRWKLPTILVACGILGLVIYIVILSFKLEDNVAYIDGVYSSGNMTKIDELHINRRCCGKYGPSDYATLNEIYYKHGNMLNFTNKHLGGLMPESCCNGRFINKCVPYKSGCYEFPIFVWLSNTYLWSHVTVLMLLFTLTLFNALFYF